MPGMITSHRACRKSSQNLRLRPKECRTLLWSAEVWRAHHRFDKGLCHKRSFGKQRREKKTSEPGGTRRRRVRHVVRPSVQHTHPWLALIEQLNETIVCFVVNLDCRMSPHRLRIRMSLWHRAPSSHAMLPPRLGYGAAVRSHVDGPFSPHLCVHNFTHTNLINTHTITSHTLAHTITLHTPTQYNNFTHTQT